MGIAMSGVMVNMKGDKAMENSGIIVNPDGYRFYWMAGNDGEISGHIEDGQTGRIVKGTSGWYRTNDPMDAAGIAFRSANLHHGYLTTLYR